MKSYEGVVTQPAAEWFKDASPIQKKWMIFWERFWGDGIIRPGAYITKRGTSVTVDINRDIVIVEYEGSRIAFYSDDDLPPKAFTPDEVKVLNSLAYYENPLDPVAVKHDLIHTIQARVNYLCNRKALPSSYKRESLNLSRTDGSNSVNCIAIVGTSNWFLIDEDHHQLMSLSIEDNTHYYCPMDLHKLENIYLSFILSDILGTSKITEVRK